MRAGGRYLITTVVKPGYILRSTAGSSLGSNKSAIAGYLNGMTKQTYATFILSLPECNTYLCHMSLLAQNVLQACVAVIVQQ